MVILALIPGEVTVSLAERFAFGWTSGDAALANRFLITLLKRITSCGEKCAFQKNGIGMKRIHKTYSSECQAAWRRYG